MFKHSHHYRHSTKTMQSEKLIYWLPQHENTWLFLTNDGLSIGNFLCHKTKIFKILVDSIGVIKTLETQLTELIGQKIALLSLVQAQSVELTKEINTHLCHLLFQRISNFALNVSTSTYHSLPVPLANQLLWACQYVKLFVVMDDTASLKVLVMAAVSVIVRTYTWLPEVSVAWNIYLVWLTIWISLLTWYLCGCKAVYSVEKEANVISEWLITSRNLDRSMFLYNILLNVIHIC